MPTIDALLRTHLHEVFAERDADARRAAIERTYREDVAFLDPDGVATGHDALHAKVGEILDGAPGDWVFSLVGDVHVVQDLGQLTWGFGPEGVAPAVSGMDVVLVQDGRIARAYTMLL